MNTVVIGGIGLIGSKTVANLHKGGHEVVAASRKAGANTITREALNEAMVGIRVVIDLSNAPSVDAKAVLEFFETSGCKLVAETTAGVLHHVTLSVVGPTEWYSRVKVAQENLIDTSVSHTRSSARPSLWISSPVRF